MPLKALTITLITAVTILGTSGDTSIADTNLLGSYIRITIRDSRLPIGQ